MAPLDAKGEQVPTTMGDGVPMQSVAWKTTADGMLVHDGPALSGRNQSMLPSFVAAKISHCANVFVTACAGGAKEKANDKPNVTSKKMNGMPRNPFCISGQCLEKRT
jgi:hypothetical protein